jgi:hypothetical protein
MSELVGPVLEVKKGPDLFIKGMQHNQIQEADWLRCLLLNNNIKYRSSHLTSESVLTAKESFVLWFEVVYLQKITLIKPTNFFCNEMVANEFDCLKFEIRRRIRMAYRYFVLLAVCSAIICSAKFGFFCQAEHMNG